MTDDPSLGRVRLTVVAPAVGVGGAERYLVEVLRQLADDAFDITLIVPDRTSILDYFTDAADGVAVLPVALVEPGHGSGRSPSLESEPAAWSRTALRAVGASAARSAQSLLRLETMRRNRRTLAPVLSAQRPDVVHVNNGGYPAASAGLAALMAARDAGVPGRSITVHGSPQPRTWAAPIERRLDGRIAAAVDRVVTVDRTVGDALVELRSFRPDQITVIPTGTPDPPTDPHVGSIRHRLGLPDDAPVVGMTASFVTGKRQDLLMDAMEIVGLRHPSAVLALVGDGPLLDDRRREAHGPDGSSRVRFLGRQPGLEVAATFDVSVLASDYEAVPLVVLEAMSLGVPVVASDVGGLGELLGNGRFGRLVPPDDAAALASAISALLDDPAERQRLGRLGREQWAAEHRLARMAESYRDLFLQLAGR